MTFDEDFKHATDILRIKMMMEDRSILELPNFKCYDFGNRVFEFAIQDAGNAGNEEMAIGCMELRFGDTRHLNWYASNVMIYNSHKRNALMIPGYSATPYCAEISEEWHFQQSLIYDPIVLRAMTVFNILNTVPSKFEYFQLKIKHLDEILRRLP